MIDGARDTNGNGPDTAPSGLRLLPIGVFSRITGLSHRALRLYADRSLLMPARVDPDTGYRYYDVHSIRAAEMIRLLRTLGVPLQEMQYFIDAAAGDNLTETLAQQKGRLTAELTRVRAAFRLLRRVDELTTMFREAPAVDTVTLPTEYCLHWSGAMRRGDFHDSYIALSEALTDRAERRGLTPAGREVVVCSDPPRKGLSGGTETVLNYELFLPVTGPTACDAPPDLALLEGGRFACSAFSGPYFDGYRFAYARQIEWLADSGLALRGHIRMRFVRDERDTEDAARYVTELIWPITEAEAPGDAASERADLAHRWLDLR